MLASLLSFDGRIRRGQWWLGMVVLLVVMIVGIFVVLTIFSVDFFSAMSPLLVEGASIDSPEVMAVLEQQRGPLTTMSWILFAVGLVLTYPYLTLSIKRRHDRGRSGIDVVIFVALSLLLSLLSALGIGATTTVTQNSVRIGQEGWMAGVGFAMFVYFIYLVVVLGFLSGDNGSNRYGPEPT